MTPEQVNDFVREVWPLGPSTNSCIEVSDRHSLAKLDVDPSSVRPGGFVSGPTQFGLADMALWFATFGAIGLEAMALTSELSIRYVRPAIGTELWARADLQSIGSRTIVGSVTVWTDDNNKPSAVCQGSYAIPKTR